MTISSARGDMDVINNREIKGIYKDHDLQKLNGSHYTPTSFAHFVAARILTNFQPKNSESCSIFDPAVGDGELLFALAELLISAGFKKIDVHGFDIDPSAVAAATSRLNTLAPIANVKILEKDFTQSYSFDAPKKFDLIIANPPYVRTQSLGAKNSSKLSSDFALDGRIDLYYVFLLGIKNFMHSNSVAGFIVSNRFMTTKSGAAVRKGLSEAYQMDEIWDLGDTRLFDAAVLPAVLVFSEKKDNKKQALFTSMYSTSNLNDAKKAESVFAAALAGTGVYTLDSSVSFEVKAGHLQTAESQSDVWRISNEKFDSWIAKVADHTECTFGKIGKIKVGVKTTADKVFIPKDWTALSADFIPETEVLFPLITHHFARRFKENEGNTRKILYPHISVEGKKQNIDLSKFPKTAKYLESHRAQLSSREYVIEAGRQWFEIWVPHDPGLWKNSKIVFRDISEKPTFWMDKSGAIVNGDCYWLTNSQGVSEDYLWIALAVANSTFIESFYDHKFNNKLYAGRRRFMTQYVEQFPIPKLDSAQKSELIKLTKEIYEKLPGDSSQLEAKLDQLIWTSFGF